MKDGAFILVGNGGGAALGAAGLGGFNQFLQ